MTTLATTNKLHSIKDQKEQKVSDLLKTCSVFFAFSTEQFEKNKTPLQEGEKYVHIGAGGYMPKSKAESFKTGLDDIDKWYKSALKSNRLRKQNIAYELNNHEAYYTMDIHFRCFR